MKDLNINCSSCGAKTCEEFRQLLKAGKKQENECIYYSEEATAEKDILREVYDEVDMLGNEFDFCLSPIGNEISARKIISPFRPDIIEKLNIQVGDIVMGRPMGAGCPVTHVLKVYDVDYISGLLYTHVVGPVEARNNPNVIDIKNYYMTGFEGVITKVRNYPKFGQIVHFLPGFCMLRLNHNGMVNMVLEKSNGETIVRIENISISSGRK